MGTIRFWNPLTGRTGYIGVDKIICKGCKKEIKGKFVTTANSFDFYHPSCFKKLTKPVIVITDDMINQGAKPLTEKKFKQWLKDFFSVRRS